MTRPVALGALAAAGLLAIFLFFGCDRSPNSTGAQKSARKSGTHTTRSEFSPQRCSEFLVQAWDMLQPERLGVSAERAVAVDVLNQWLRGCGEQVDVSPPGEQSHAELKELITPAAWERMRESHFAARDAEHIRNAILFREIGQFTLAGAESDVDRAARLFDYVVRNVALEGSEEQLPLTPFQILIFGRGSAEDRAWIFAELLRQIRIDAVIVRPGSAGDAAEDGSRGDWLVGALLGTQVYLFDAVRGSALPSPGAEGSAAWPVAPAALEELAAAGSDDSGSPDYHSPQVELIGYSSYWSERMQRLQESLSGERAVVVYDPLIEAGPERGGLARVREAGGNGWKPSRVGMWGYPEEQLIASENMDSETAGRLEARRAPFTAPIPVVDVGTDRQVELGPPQQDQLKTRLRQLSGEFAEAIRSYLAIRMAERKPPTAEDAFIPPDAEAAVLAQLPPDVQRIHQRAAEDAFFFTGTSQMEMGQENSAYRTFAEYLSRYPQGAWRDQARRLVAIILVKAGRPEVALRLLEQIDPSSPQSAELEFLAGRLREAAPAPAAEETAPAP